MSLLLGIDLGTSYFKAGLYTDEGVLRGLGRRPAPVCAPEPGRREMAPEEFWAALRETVGSALKAADADGPDVSALSYSSQANSFLLLDAAMRPLTPVIIWQDVRSLPNGTPLTDYWTTPEFFGKTGLKTCSPNFMPGKLEWFRHHQTGTWKQVAHVLTLSDYLSSTLTGDPSGDSGTAALTGLWNIPANSWHNEALSLAEIDQSWLPSLVRPGAPLGTLCAEGARRLGLARGTSMAAGSLDHHAAAVGSGVGRLAPASLSTGTVLAALRLIDGWQPVAGAFHGPDWKAGRHFALVADNRGAAILEEFRRRYAPGDEFETLLEAADQVRPETVLPVISTQAWDDPDPRYFGELSPMDRDARGAIVRSIMEAIARRQRILLERLFGKSPPETVIATGGGARSSLWLQIQSRALGARVLAPESAERACLGAALLAGVAAGLFRDVDEASRRMVKAGRAVEPDA